MIVCSFLIRLEPFTQHYLKLQASIIKKQMFFLFVIYLLTAKNVYTLNNNSTFFLFLLRSFDLGWYI